MKELVVPPSLSTEAHGGCIGCIGQVPCNPPGNMVVKVMDARPTEGGYLKIVNTQLAGNAVVSDVKVREAVRSRPFHTPTLLISVSFLCTRECAH